MRLLSSLAGFVTVFGSTLIAQAQMQQPQVPTTVQLPTFSFFTVQTTVSVPDSGGAYLGGINRGASGSTTRGFGPLRNRALSGGRAASGVSVSATVIDREEIDRALLAEAAAKRGPPDDLATTKAADLSRSVGRSDARVAVGGAADHGASAAPEPWFALRPTATQRSALPDSVAAIRERNAAATEARTKEIADYYAKARQAEAEGKVAVAKVFYQMVAKRDSGQLKQQAEARLAALGVGQASRLP